MTAASLRLVTQNAWGGAPLWKQRRDRLVEALRQLRPDVIGLQEVHASSSDGDASQAHELAELLDYDVTFAPARVTPTGHCEGVALLWRSAAVLVDRTVLALTRDADDPLDAPHPRVVLRAVIRFPDREGAELDAMVTHLSLSKSARARSMEELRAFASIGRPLAASAVIMGDFNATPDEPALGTLASGGWVDAWNAQHAGARGGTWPAGAPFRRIDYVFASPRAGWRVADCARTAVSGSDHVGLIAHLESEAS